MKTLKRVDLNLLVVLVTGCNILATAQPQIVVKDCDDQVVFPNCAGLCNSHPVRDSAAEVQCVNEDDVEGYAARNCLCEDEVGGVADKGRPTEMTYTCKEGVIGTKVEDTTTCSRYCPDDKEYSLAICSVKDSMNVVLKDKICACTPKGAKIVDPTAMQEQSKGRRRGKFPLILTQLLKALDQARKKFSGRQ